jgi:hypothetical protein
MDTSTKINLIVDGICLAAIVINYFVVKHIYFKR